MTDVASIVHGHAAADVSRGCRFILDIKTIPTSMSAAIVNEEVKWPSARPPIA